MRDEDGKKKRNWRQSRAFKRLEEDLGRNLDSRGLLEQVYRDKMQEYLDFWVLKQELMEDIRERGPVVTDERGRVGENRSISLTIQTSRQMLNIWQALGLKPGEAPGGMIDDVL